MKKGKKTSLIIISLLITAAVSLFASAPGNDPSGGAQNDTWSSNTCEISLTPPGHVVMGFSAVAPGAEGYPSNVSQVYELTRQSDGSYKSAATWIYYINHLSSTTSFKIEMVALPMVSKDSITEMIGYGVDIDGIAAKMPETASMQISGTTTKDTEFPVYLGSGRKHMFSSAYPNEAKNKKIEVHVPVENLKVGTFSGTLKLKCTVE